MAALALRKPASGAASPAPARILSLHEVPSRLGELQADQARLVTKLADLDAEEREALAAITDATVVSADAEEARIQALLEGIEPAAPVDVPARQKRLAEIRREKSDVEIALARLMQITRAERARAQAKIAEAAGPLLESTRRALAEALLPVHAPLLKHIELVEEVDAAAGHLGGTDDVAWLGDPRNDLGGLCKFLRRAALWGAIDLPAELRWLTDDPLSSQP